MQIRAHHLLCMRNFRGKGYNDAFVANFKRIIQELDKISLITQADVICQACPHCQDGCKKNGDCSESIIQQKDRKVLDKLNVAENTLLSINELNQLLDNLLDFNTFHELCGDCEWFWFCEKLLRD